MEYVSRGSLRPYVGRLTLAQIAGVLEGVLAGLAHAEQAGSVHRDLKPENLMVTAEGRVKIADFGIAKATQTAGMTAALTATGSAVGTPTYMAPEQAMAEPVGPWTDLYSVGVMAYEHVTGRPPFHDAQSPMALVMRHVNEPVVPAITVTPDLDRALSEWIDGLLVKDPAQRPQSAIAAWEALEEIIVGLLDPLWRRADRLVEPESAPERPRPLTRRRFRPTSATRRRPGRPPQPRRSTCRRPARPPRPPRPRSRWCR
jgi:serine/threonine protein kinase